MTNPSVPVLNASQRSLDFAREVLEILTAIVPSGGALHEPEIGAREKEYVADCLDSGWVSSVGKYVDQFEAMLCDITGAQYAVATVNGTAALHAALLLAGVEPGDEVLTPALGFVAQANAISYCGATPHFIDVEEVTLGVDAVRLSDYLDSVLVEQNGSFVHRQSGRVVRAVMVAHILGHPARVDQLLDVASKFRLPVIEDAAESLGSELADRHTGTFGLVGALSFNGNKTVTTGGGGAILTNDSEIAALAKHLTTTAKTQHAWEFNHDMVAFNYRMPNLNAALGCAQLERLPDFVERKRTLARKYLKGFDGVEGVNAISEPPGARSNYWLNAILLEPKYEKFRDTLHRLCHDNGIMTRSAWTPLQSLPMYSDCPAMSVPVTQSLHRRLIKLPSSPRLAESGSAGA